MHPHATRRDDWTSSVSALALAISAVIVTSVIPRSGLVAQEKVDVATIEKIKSEEMNHSQVMEIMSWLSDVYGPRLTWSPNATRAKVWAMDQMKSWGLANVHEERGTHRRDWAGRTSDSRSMAISPMPFIVEAVPRHGRRAPGDR